MAKSKLREEMRKRLTVKLGTRMIGENYPNVGEIIELTMPLIDQYAQQVAIEARIDELTTASKLNEQQALDPVINPHQPARMRAWFKDRLAILEKERGK